jgi:anti-repressor protein
MCEVVKTFVNEDFGKLRVVCIDNEFFLISKDLGEFLGYVNTRNTTITHVDKKDRKHCLINTSFGIQKMVVVNKNGVYSLIYNVKSQRGKNARDWIIQNVIPELYENKELSVLNYPQRNERSSNMNEIIKINYDSEQPTVLGRDLHKALEVKTAYKDWFPRMCDYGFEEGKDFCSFLSESTGGRPSTDHQLTIPMAKEICMLQRSEKGKMFRQYFISIEEQWNTPDVVIARALLMTNKKLEELKNKNLLLKAENKALEAENTKKKNIIQENQPKVDFAEGITASKGTISMSQFAKMVSKETGKTIGRNAILLWLRQQKILMRTNEPYQMYKKYFEYIPVLNHWGKGGFATRVTGKGQKWLFERLRKAGVIGEKKNTKLVSVSVVQGDEDDLSWVDEI